MHLKDSLRRIHVAVAYVVYVKSWRYDRKGDRTIFFSDFYSLFLLIHWWFPNDLKLKHFSDFVMNDLWNCHKSDGREAKIHDFGLIFFSNLLTFWKFGIIFYYLLRQSFQNSYQCYQNYIIPSFKLWQTIKQV